MGEFFLTLPFVYILFVYYFIFKAEIYSLGCSTLDIRSLDLAAGRVVESFEMSAS